MTPVYFWRESELVGYLSQWYYCPFRDDNDPEKIYQTAEHYMMHQKALLFNDPTIAAEILTATHPRDVKTLGRAISNFDEATWTAQRLSIVTKGNYLKFTNAVTEEGFRVGTPQLGKAGKGKPQLPLIKDRGGSLKMLLLSTRDREIVEASPYDRIWGIGLTAAEAEGKRDEWGLNLLGKALMDVREMLRKEDVEEREKQAEQ